MLYEVITIANGDATIVEPVAKLKNGSDTVDVARITSYNVCYTKLLRIVASPFAIHSTVPCMWGGTIT